MPEEPNLADTHARRTKSGDIISKIREISQKIVRMKSGGREIKRKRECLQRKSGDMECMYIKV